MVKIGIHGAPRSGTTWLANIFNSNEHVAYRQQPLFSYAFKAFLNEKSTNNQINNFFKNIYESTDDYLHQIQEIKDKKVPIFKKLNFTHLVYKEVRYHYILDNLLINSDMNLIVIIRNPLSVLSSFFNAPAEFKPDWQIDNEWLRAPSKNQGAKENYFGYLKWKESALLFHKLNEKYENRVKIISYSDLISNTLPLIEKLFKTFDLNMTSQTFDFIKQSRSTEDSNAYSVFKKNQNDDKWKSFISEEIYHYICNDLKGTELETYLN